MSTYDQIVLRGETKKEIESILSFYKEGVSIEVISKAMNVTKDYVKKVISGEITPKPDIFGRDKK